MGSRVPPSTLRGAASRAMSTMLSGLLGAVVLTAPGYDQLLKCTNE